ncbi:MAG: hypothetical protein ABEJ76_07855 [Halanaeroarchaeum sp.]
MMDRRLRWAVLLVPLVFPWVVVTWDGGAYTVFSLGWVDPGPRFVSIATYLGRGAALGLRSFAVAYPLALALYLGALGLAGWEPLGPETGGVTTGMLVLAGLNVGFYALGLDGQAGIGALPLGALWLWAAAALEYFRFYVR